ncbi:MAG TPA: arsenic resistance N-acetyltransferase ArsN2 [Gemmatimonadaceae bacterium]|nr:arsenic resistance N-acetyltransferase ArsN2 [Gemmatimonadaceae bacterium]
MACAASGTPSLTGTQPADVITGIVREKYGEAARRVLDGEGIPADCCGSTGCCSGAAAPSCDPITSNLYVSGETDELPSAAVLASLGCGNPTALAELHAGEVVLDLGSGGGIDVLLSARRVGPSGKAYGLDMTDEMLELARRNAAEAGVTNVEFLRGQIERIPLPDASVDVIISNCVINLSGDKRRVLAEAFRVLKPGGRFAVSDVVVRGPVPAAVRRSMELWVGCVAGALEESEFLRLLSEVGFAQPSIEPTRVYRAEDARAFLTGAGLDASAADEIDGRFMAAFVRATKPVTAPVLRAATLSDLDAVERLLAAAGLPDAGVADLFATRAADFVVAEDPAGGELLAVGGLEVCCDDALLRSVAVREDARKLGLGRALVLRLIAEAERRGLRALYLLTMTAEDYFPRFGFARIGRAEVPAAVAATAEFTSACPASAVVMRRGLAAA